VGREDIRSAMQAFAGVSRSAEGLDDLAGLLAADAAEQTVPASLRPAGWERANMVLIGRAVAALAAARHESRGAHWRADYPEPRAEWRLRQVAQLAAGGDLVVGPLAAEGAPGALVRTAVAAV
jgi:aspartate oxidase